MILVDGTKRVWDNEDMETNMRTADESGRTRPMTTEEQAQMLDEEADFYVRYNGAKADEHRWVQSLRGGADRLRRSLVTAQEMSAVYAANRMLLNRAERTEEAEDRTEEAEGLVAEMRDQLANMEEALMASDERAVKAEWLVADMRDQLANIEKALMAANERADSRRAFKDAIQGVELPPIGRDDVDHARIALKTYISQWCAAGITAEVSELIHDLIRAAEVRGLNRGLPPASWTRTDR